MAPQQVQWGSQHFPKCINKIKTIKNAEYIKQYGKKPSRNNTLTPFKLQKEQPKLKILGNTVDLSDPMEEKALEQRIKEKKLTEKLKEFES